MGGIHIADKLILPPIRKEARLGNRTSSSAAAAAAAAATLTAVLAPKHGPGTQSKMPER